jgi:hypothetical protein
MIRHVRHFFLSTFRQRIKKTYLNTILAFICANILHISIVQLFKTSFQRLVLSASQVDKRGEGSPQLIGPLKKGFFAEQLLKSEPWNM